MMPVRIFQYKSCGARKLTKQKNVTETDKKQQTLFFHNLSEPAPFDAFSSPSPFSFLLVGGALARENVFSCQGPAD